MTTRAPESAPCTARYAARRSRAYVAGHDRTPTKLMAMFGSFQICQWRTGSRGSDGFALQKLPRGPYRAISVRRNAAYVAGSRGGENGWPGVAAAQLGVRATSPSTSMPLRAAAATLRSIAAH